MTQSRTPPSLNPDGALHNPPRLQSGQKMQDAIGRALEAHYVELVREPIPDRLLKLLAELEAGELHHE